MKEVKYNDHPIAACINVAKPVVATGEAVVFQKFTCFHCRSRQTIDVPNVFYTHGTCEECGSVTDMQIGGCNYLLHRALNTDAIAKLKVQYGDFSPTLTLVDCNEYVANNPVRKQ